LQIKTWTPFLEFEKDFRAWLDRMTEGGEFPFRPSTDVVQDGGQIVVTMEIPGIELDDISVTILDDILTVKGERRVEREFEEDDRYMRERRFGRFERRIPLPDATDAKGVRATYDKGVLTVSIPTIEATPPTATHIEIEAV